MDLVIFDEFHPLHLLPPMMFELPHHWPVGALFKRDLCLFDPDSLWQPPAVLE